MSEPDPSAPARRGPILPKWLITLVLLLLGGAVLLVAAQLGLGPSDLFAFLRVLLDEASAMVKTIPPWAFVICFALITSLPVPSSPLLIAAGLAYPPGVAIAAACAGLLGNIAISYLLAARVVRRPIKKLVARRGYTLPDRSGAGSVELILLVRFIPAVPLVFQSYVLGLLRVPFLPYLLISTPLACAGGIGLVLAGQGFYEGRVSIIVLAASWLIFVTLAIKLVAQKLRKKNSLKPSDEI